MRLDEFVWLASYAIIHLSISYLKGALGAGVVLVMI